MTTPTRAIAAVALIAAICVSIYEARRATGLFEEVQRLQQQQKPLSEQVEQLQQERDQTRRQLAALRDEQERSSRNTAELLRLRGDVGALRKQRAEASRAATPPSSTMVQTSQAVDPLEQQKQMARAKGIDGRNYSTHFVLFATQSQGWFPTNWEQVARFTNAYPVSGTNEFEIVHKRQINQAELGANAGRTILVREFLAWPTLDGQWGKIYGFADGRSEVVILPDGNFAAWEEQNTFNPESSAK
jgi:hypothetical protein